MSKLESNRRQFLATAAALTAIGSAPSRAADGLVTVRAPAGAVRGRVLDDLHVFTGIPFGAATAGSARFRPPRPTAPWADTFDATQTAKIPPQPTNFLFPQLPGTPSEDCLQLNIWAPSKPGRYPVFVWIYGGGNMQGSCAEPLYDGAAFARDGIVFVNFNYRLGALGFLELGDVLGPDYRGSANNALLDQLLALQWVQRNISAFGGDPAQITVAGQSAGGANLNALLGMPAAKGLFQRAIVASGAQGAIDIATAEQFAKAFVAQLGGADRLHTAGFDEILSAQAKAMDAWPYELPFRAVAASAALPSMPEHAVAAGSARDVDLMIGWCHDETPPLIPEAVASNPAFVPKANPSDIPRIQRLMAAYAKADPALSQAERVWKASSAEIFELPSQRMADAQAAAGGKVHMYRLDYAVQGGPFGNKTVHGFDIPMAFEQMSSPIAKFYGFSAEDAPMAKTVHAMWSSFIRKGAVDAGLPDWAAYDRQHRSAMILDRTSHVATDITKFDREVWDRA